MFSSLLTYVLVALGAGFLLANVRILIQFVRFLRLRSSALLIWPGRRPAGYRMFLVIGAVLGLVIMVKLIVLNSLHLLALQRLHYVFGESMMLLYYSYLVPLSMRIGRGFYEDGVWLEDGYMPYANIGGMSWREEPTSQDITLLLIPRMRRLARKLVVPHQHYGAARRLLRDKIKGHDIHFTGKALDLGAHDERDDV